MLPCMRTLPLHPCPQGRVGSPALTKGCKLLVQGQAGLQAAPEQLHCQLHVAGTQGIVSSHRVLWRDVGQEGCQARRHMPTGTGTHHSVSLKGLRLSCV